jgi:hypothetical protein
MSKEGVDECEVFAGVTKDGDNSGANARQDEETNQKNAPNIDPQSKEYMSNRIHNGDAIKASLTKNLTGSKDQLLATKRKSLKLQKKSKPTALYTDEHPALKLRSFPCVICGNLV